MECFIQTKFRKFYQTVIFKLCPDLNFLLSNYNLYANSLNNNIHNYKNFRVFNYVELSLNNCGETFYIFKRNIERNTECYRKPLSAF